MKNHTDYNDLFKTIEENQMGQLSSLLMDNGISAKLTESAYMLVNKDILQRFITLQQITEALGWLDHSGDWDPFLILNLNNGTQLQTPHGYSDSQIEGENLICDGPEELDEDDETRYWNQERQAWIIPIIYITEIHLHR